MKQQLMHLFFCNDQQHGKSYLFPPGLWSSVPAIAFLNKHHTLYCTYSMWPILRSAWLANFFCEFFLQC
jgi:hypothetical protein